MTIPTPVRLGSTYRITVPFYALSDGTTPTDLAAAPTLQVYLDDGTTTVGTPVTCTKTTTGVYYGDIQFTVTNGFAPGAYIWKMFGISGAAAVNQTGWVSVTHVV